MRVGIVTITDFTNYGNRLQNYAMCHLIQKKFRCDVTSLAVTTDKPYCNGHYIVWLKEKIASILCVFPTFAEKHFGYNITRWDNFRSWNKNLPTKVYYECEKLSAKIGKDFDYLIAGSDQIWNYHFAHERFYNYFLKFADEEKRIAISASFGVERIPDEWKQIYIDGLKEFSHISVREDAGQAIVKNLLDRDVPVLIDPTMMLSEEEWLKVSKKPRVDCAKPYVLKYYLGDEAEEDKIDSWAKENGYEVYELLNKEIPELYSVGPGEFISLINNASLVCSDSFHCIVFSIIFSKPFLVYSRLGTGNYMTSRMDTLLGKFGFLDRWKNLVSEDDYLNCNYEFVQELLEKEQQKFMEYLSDVLN